MARESATLPQQVQGKAGNPFGDFVPSGPVGVLNAAAHANTVYYGGTVWDGVDGRWEALIDSCWTFDSGVATEIIVGFPGGYPGVNPYKQDGLHAYMEGWIGFDNSYSDLPYFRVLSDTDPRWGSEVCVGANATSNPGVLGGDYSFWCGVFPGEADTLCYASGQGYGNSWRMCLEKTYQYDGFYYLLLEYDYVNETEPGFDFTTVEVDSGAGYEHIMTYDGAVAGFEHQRLGWALPDSAREMTIRFCFTSDGGWSDEDGLFSTTYGAFAVDNIRVTQASGVDFTDFEGGDANGWTLMPGEPGQGGEWSNLVNFATVNPMTPCACSLTGNVLVFEDQSEPGVSHNRFQDNLAGSPWIELEPGHDGPVRFIETDMYTELPLVNYVFAQFGAKWYPDYCPQSGVMRESPWVSAGRVFYFGGTPRCTAEGEPGTRVDLSGIIPVQAKEVRIAVGVISYCEFFGNCTYLSNITPVFDNVKLGVAGNLDAPLITVRPYDLPQDAFPANGTIRADAPGRLDAGVIANAPRAEIGTSTGDTLVVHGAQGGAEVYVEFQVDPGPAINGSLLSDFYARVTPAGRPGWYSARMDTAEKAGIPIEGTWMTAYHEDDPNFIGTDDTAEDPDDFGPYGGIAVGHLLNDIFSDRLFVPGTRVNLFYRSRYLAGSTWYVLPDTTGGNYIEWECLPSSMTGGDEWNCLLYVDHFDGGGAQPLIEAGLNSILGTGSTNFETTNWDRYDVRAPSSQQASGGRPLYATYGMTVVQILAYTGVVWNSGDLGAFNLVKEDADVLIPYLTLIDYQGNNLYLSGDGIASSMMNNSATEPSTRVLLRDIMGVEVTCDTYRDADCPVGSMLDADACIPLDPVTGAVASLTRSYLHAAQGNGCPEQRSFDVLAPGTPLYSGVATGDERYDNTGNGGKVVEWASIGTDAATIGQPQYRTVLDGVSVHHRRDPNLGPCSTNGNTGPVTERLTEVLTYLGHPAASHCQDTTAGIGVPKERAGTSFRTSLAAFSPNPLRAGASGRIAFTMAREGKARIDVFDLNGRLVNTIYDGTAREGENEAIWNGNDTTGRPVAAGVYFYRLDAAGKTMSKKMVVVRGR